MDYLPYVIAAYAVFAGVLLADALAGHLAVRRARRTLRRPAPGRRAPAASPARELER